MYMNSTESDGFQKNLHTVSYLSLDIEGIDRFFELLAAIMSLSVLSPAIALFPHTITGNWPGSAATARE